MRTKIFSIVTIALLMVVTSAIAQKENTPPADDLAQPAKITPLKKWYLTNAMDGVIFSTSSLEVPGETKQLSTLRFTYFFNFGTHFNYNFNERFGVYTGVGIRNIGLIEKNGDTTIKRRVYTLNVPVAFKIGNMVKNNYLVIGGGIDLPFNYREKTYTDRRKKAIFNEWFSDRTPAVMPYVQVGGMFNPGVAVNIQFFPGNFFNTNFTESVSGVNVKPYQGYNARLINLTLGINIPANNKKSVVTPPAVEEVD